MKMYEVKYANKDGLLNTVTIEAENAIEARKAVKTGFADCDELVKVKALDQHRKLLLILWPLSNPRKTKPPS